jgi:hypothetical protein
MSDFSRSIITKFKIQYVLLLVPAILMMLWHIMDNIFPASDGGGFFFRSVLIYEDLFLDKDNIFQSFIRFLDHVIAGRGVPHLFPALGSLILIPSLGNWNVAFALMGIFYVTLITVFSYLIIFEFTRKKYYSILSAIIIGTLPAVFANAINNVAEIALIAFLLPTFYYLYKSNSFSVAHYSKYFAVFMTLALSVRPIQALLILLFPIIITLSRGRIKNIFTNHQFITIAYLFILFLCILLCFPYLRTFGEPLYQHLIRGHFPAYNISVVTDVYLKLTITFTILLGFFTAVLLYKKQFNTFRKELSFKFKNHKNYILPTFLLIFVLNIIVWALSFHSFFYWVFSATFGSLFPAGHWNLPDHTSIGSFSALLSGSIYQNSFYAFYFSLISLFLLSLLNRKIPKPKIFIYIFASSVILPVLTLFSAQTAAVRLVSAVTICVVIFLILLGSFKKYSRLPVFLVLSFVLFKSFVFFDYSLNLKFVNQGFYNFAKNNYTGIFPRGFVQETADPIKDSDLHTLDVLVKYHQKYNFKRVYVDGSSRLTGKYGVDPLKISRLSNLKGKLFQAGGYIESNPRKYDENSYKMIANQGYDFMFLLNPLLHDDGSQKYKDDLKYRHNCFSVTEACCISSGSIESFKAILDIVIMINDGTISQTKWELVETIKQYNYDVFILKLKSE